MTRQMEEISGGENVTIAGVISDLKEKGYIIKEKITGANTVAGIVLNNSEITMDKNDTRTLIYTMKYAEGMTQYFVEVGEGYYEITIENNKISLGTEINDLGDVRSFTSPNCFN